MRGMTVRGAWMRRGIAIVVAVALMVVTAWRPSPARADTADNFIYAGIGLGIYITIIVVATTMVYSEAPETSMIPMRDLEREDTSALPVRAGIRCAPRDGQVPLLCW